MGRRMPVAGFVGGSNRLYSPQASREASINLFVERTSSSGKVPAYLRGTEGLRPFAQVDDVWTHCLATINGRTFALTGDTFSEVFDDGTTIPRGTVESDGRIGTIVSNGTAGNQVQLQAGVKMYNYDMVTDVFQEVDIGLSVEMVEFMDGYFFALIRATRRVHYSDLEDGLTWPELSYFERSWGADNIVGIKRAGRQLWVIGNQTSEVWADNGNANTPFAPIQGVFLDRGSIARATIVRDGETLIWLDQDERGGGLVVRAKGYQPEKISSYAVDVSTQSRQGALSQSVAFAHQTQGHLFYWLQIPDLNPTAVIDLAENGLWCERGMWNTTLARYDAHLATCHIYAFEKHLVGVRESGVIYEMSPEFFDDRIMVP